MGFDSDTLSKTCSKQLKNEVWTKLRSKVRWGFGTYDSKGVDKNVAKCSMGFGRITKIYHCTYYKRREAHRKPIWTIWKRALSKITRTLMRIELSQKVGADPTDSAS